MGVRSNRGRLAVIGGGVIGLSTAWRAAARGLDVTVIDPRPGSGSSWVAGGMLAPVSEAWPGEDALLELGAASLRAWPDFAAELAASSGREPGLRTEGTVVVAADRADQTDLDRLAAYLAHLGREVDRLDGREMRRLEPALGPAVRAGLSVPGDLAVDNRMLLTALRAACDRGGVRFLAREAVSAASRPEDGAASHPVDRAASRPEDGAASHPVDREASRPAGRAASHPEDRAASRPGDGAPSRPAGDPGAASAGGRVWLTGPDGAEPLDFDHVVIAAGPWSTGLHERLRGALHPVKGEVLRLRARPGTLPPPRRTVRGRVRGRPVYLVPRDEDGLVVGATQYEAGFDTAVTAGSVRDLLRDAEVLLPAIAEYELLECAAGLRPATADNLPLIGELAPGLLVAAGHHRNGFLLAPITADAVVDALLGLPTASVLSAADPARLRSASSPGEPTIAASHADLEESD
uniref:FAD-dependent oxidoreductase n=2 Tax=Actinoalloteichus TaxID=65496 RepID=UPI000952D48C